MCLLLDLNPESRNRTTKKKTVITEGSHQDGRVFPDRNTVTHG